MSPSTTMPVINITSIRTSSNGAWQGDNPLDHALPLLIVQTTLILVVSRLLALLLKPLRQPKVIAEIAGGILLGPSAIGRNKEYFNWIFPKWSTPILESVASVGLLFFLFLVGLELDLSSIRRSGKRALGIAVAGISLPFVCGVAVAFVLRKTIEGEDQVGYTQFLVFIGVALSITAFPVLSRILAELKLLTTQVGETAMAAAAFNDVTAWILLALAVALVGNGEHKSPLISIWVLISGGAFVAIMLTVIRPAMKWIARRCSSKTNVVDEAYICFTLTGVLVSGFITDLIGIHSIFGAFVFGLTIPKGGVLAERLIERIEDFVSGLLLPLYFASSGLKTDVATIRNGRSWGLLVLVITTAFAGKIIGTFVVAMMFMIPARESLTLGVLMNTKGLVELIVLDIGKEKRVLNDESFAILVLMALFTTFITTPTVMAIYKPARGGSSTSSQRKLGDLTTTKDTKDELRILACAHGSGNVPPLVSLIESIRSTKKSQLKLYIMHLVELTERSSSIIMVQRVRKNGLPFINQSRSSEWNDRVTGAFQANSQLGRISVRTMTSISNLTNMHEDICQVGENKNVTLIILPFHKQLRGEGDQIMDDVGHGWRGVNQRVLKNAPCSVAVLVDRGFGNGSQISEANTNITQRVCIMFFGGPDDREALELGGRMAEHPVVKVTIVRFVQKEGQEKNHVVLQLSPSERCSTELSYSFSTAIMNPEKEKACPLNFQTYCDLDETAIAEFKSKWEGTVEYTENVVSNIVEGVLAIGRSGDYDLIFVGKGRFPSSMVAELAYRQAEHAELGPIGDILASSGHGVVSSVLVIQQHDLAHAKEAPVSKVVHSEPEKSADESWSVGEITKDAVKQKQRGRMETERTKKKAAALSLQEFISITYPLLDLEKESEISASIGSGALRNLDSAQKKGSTILNLKCVDAQTGLMGKTLLEFQSNKGDVLPAHKFGTHDVVVLKPNKADLGSPALGQGVVYRLKDSSITVAFDDVPDEGLNSPLRLEKVANEVTYRRMKDALIQLSKGVHRGPAADLIPVLFGERQPTKSKKDVTFTPINSHLDHSQLVRLGHPARLLPQVLDSALDAQVLRGDNSALANDIRKEMKALNGKLLKTKDKSTRRDIQKELRTLSKEERKRQQLAVIDVIKNADVVLTTLTGAFSHKLNTTSFDLVIIDEAAQALEITCWLALLKGSRCILAGDHLQLPPTIQSVEAEKKGLGRTLFERLTDLYGDEVTSMLTVQYRMHELIMNWSSKELYNSKIKAHPSVAAHMLFDLEGVKRSSSTEPTLLLVDIAGCDMEEKKDEEDSTMNEGEAEVAVAHAKRLVQSGVQASDIGIITPYAAQVVLLKILKNNDAKLKDMEISTVDGFQGREKEAIIISMVRSNSKKEVGFLSDHRRMNVAVTRARRQCCLVCDTETVSGDGFLKRLIEHFEEHGEYLRRNQVSEAVRVGIS
ncbi:hypothetical protein NC653_015727 [Populus alba x Populus x berolinensis]|uniref:Cation/H+ exchanger domain-containing protein n=1 Tax=Populus alba x Populus x berolinensis TaxID=444605 RepID=A0AAD6QL92_9ROSI|nr:hypothetical protein NC653_015727 [Populus alba x Populus x berolinensis]